MMRISIAGLVLFFAFLVAGCGGGGSSGGGGGNDAGGGSSPGESQDPVRSQSEIVYQEWEFETRPGHRSLGIFVDPATGDFVADEFQETPGGLILMGGYVRMDGFSATVRLNEEGLPREIEGEDGSKVILSEYDKDSATVTFVGSDGFVAGVERIGFDPTILAQIREIAQSAMLVSAETQLQIAQVQIASNNRMWNGSALAGQLISLGLNGVGCVAGVAATTTIVGGVAAGYFCTSFLLSAASTVAGPDSGWSTASGLFNTGGCIALDPLSCGALAADAYSREVSGSVVRVQMLGDGYGIVLSRPQGLDCACRACECSHVFVGGGQVQLEATPASGSSFVAWGGDCSGVVNTCEVSTRQNRNVTARFVPSSIEHRLWVDKAGTGAGTVTSNPSGINCGSTCSASFPNNQLVTLTATPSTGSTFAGWSGACAGSSATCTVNMTETESVTASFNSIVGMNRTTNLLAHYSFDEGEGFVIRDAVGGRDFRSSTSDIWSNSGVVGSALEILGRTDVSITRAPDLDFSMPLGTKISLSGWIMRTKGGTTQVILSRGRNTLAEPSLVWLFTTNDNLAFSYCPVSPNLCNIWRSHEPLTQVNVWQHFALTYTYGLGESLAAYRNGQRLSGAWAVGGGNVTPANENNGLRIGSQLDANDNPIAPLEGHIDELMLWKGRILTGDEVSALHMNP